MPQIRDFQDSWTAAVIKLAALVLMVAGGGVLGGWGGALFALGLGLLFASLNVRTVNNP